MNNQTDKLNTYYVWDRSIRIFHWLNVLCITGLMFFGLAILYSKELGVSADGKVLLKTLHVYIGYVFVINLVWRLIWLFVGNKYSHWKAVLPLGKKYKESLVSFIRHSKSGNSPAYLGHNPVARLMIIFLLLLLSSQAITGLVLAGTDLYMPPFGQKIMNWVAVADENNNKMTTLKPGSKEHVDPVKYDEMRAFRKPFITVHYYAFFILLGAIFLHIGGVIFSEFREGSGLVSAMLTGKKVISGKPADEDE